MKLKGVLNTPFMKAFKKFISKGNVIELAVGLIMATYFGAIVKSLVNDIIMPPVGKLIGGIDFASFKYVIQPAVEAEGTVEIAIRYGVFINTIITFLIVAFAIFLVVRELYTLIIEEHYDMISGWKKKRYDSYLFKNLPSKIFNWAARLVSGIKLHDFNCGLKAYRSDVVKTIEVYGEMHRYIPVLAKQAGFGKIGEKVVQHQKRKFGHSKFGADRFVKGFLDLITLWFLHRFGRRPIYFFGLIGSIMLLMGFSFSLYLGIDKLFVNPTGRMIAQRPQFYVALTTMILGSQFFLAGFLGEIVIRNRDHKTRYKIKEHLPPNSKGNM